MQHQWWQSWKYSRGKVQMIPEISALRSAESWIHHLPLLVPMLIVAISHQAIPQKPSIWEIKESSTFQQRETAQTGQVTSKTLPYLLSCIFPISRKYFVALSASLWKTPELYLFSMVCVDYWVQQDADSLRRFQKTIVMYIINVIELFYFQEHGDYSKTSPLLSFCLGTGNSSAFKWKFVVYV